MEKYHEFIQINGHSITPKYRQLANAIIDGVISGKIVKNEILPSLHECCVALDISKNSVEKAYNTLKEEGVVASVRGKGYYILNDFSG